MMEVRCGWMLDDRVKRSDDGRISSSSSRQGVDAERIPLL